MNDDTPTTQPDEIEALRNLVALQSSEMDRLRRDLHEAHRVLTRLASVQLGMVGG